MHSLLDDGACEVTPTDGLYSDCVVRRPLVAMAQVEHRVGLDTGSATNSGNLRKLKEFPERSGNQYPWVVSQSQPHFEYGTAYRQVRPTKLDKIKNFQNHLYVGGVIDSQILLMDFARCCKNFPKLRIRQSSPRC